MKRFGQIAVFFLAIALLISCTERVPPGYNGMVMTPDGLTGVVVGPGNVTCYNRDRLVLWEKAEVAKTEQLKILCADDLNFSFDLKLRVTLDADDPQKITYVLDKMGSKIKWEERGARGVLEFSDVYNTYVMDPARSTARKVVSKYATTQIREHREAIEKAIKEDLLKSIAGTPVKVTYIATSNFDYPDVVTKAVENQRRREIEIGEEKAKQAMELLRIQNRETVAEKTKSVRLKEAEADGIYMQVLGKYLNKDYLEFKKIERDMILYKNVGAGDKVIVTNGSTVVPIVDARQNSIEPNQPASKPAE
jgi:hypothetical protein